MHRRLAPQPGMSAVDLGCGTGQWASQMFRWGMQVTGYDFSGEALRQARRGGTHPRLSYAHWDINTGRPPRALQPQSVDLVTCRRTVAYLHLPRFLATITWMLKPQGVLYLLTSQHSPGRGPMDRGLTEAQLGQLMAGWRSCLTREFSRSSRAVLLRGHDSTAKGAR
ncbi:class I SAM-dependent methyltransferase [Streptomyces alfalfae]